MAEIRQSEKTPKDAATFRKLPFRAFKLFKEGEEEIEAFLQDFERLCQIHEVLSQDWVVLLASNLTGRAADAYRALEDEDAKDYDRVKEALLARFAITPEASRIKFRESRKQTDTTYVEWAHRLQRNLKSWFQGSHANTIEDITQLVLLEQFFNHTPPVVQDWVRDKQPQTVQQAATLADEYLDSRRSGENERYPLSRPSLPASKPTSVPQWSASRPPARPNPPTGPKCYTCNRIGHLQRFCPTQSTRYRETNHPSRPAAHCFQNEPNHRDVQEECGELFEADPVQAAAGDNRQHHRQAVWVNGQPAQGLRDSGATITLIQPHMIPQSARTGQTVAVRVAGGKVLRLSTAQVLLDWGSGERHVRVGLLRELPAEVLLGNDLGHLTSSYAPEAAMAVTTRRQSQLQGNSTSMGTQVRSNPPTLPQPDNTMSWDSTSDVRQETQSDPTLAGYRDRAGKDPGGLGEDRIEWEGGFLYRYTEGMGTGKRQGPHKQLVVPQKYRRELLRLAHDIPLAGHLGIAKTRSRLSHAFFWPRLHAEVREYCRTCETCQKVGKTGDHPKASLQPLPIIREPFSRIAVDIIGPLARPSATGKKYILTVVDYATRYPEAIPLSNIQADTVADALLRVFTRVGFPQEILSDQGTQFTAELTQQLWRLCGIKPLQSAPYHPQTNGLCERFNGTLKQLLRSFVESRKDWEKYLPHLLFAYREVPQESTGFSPFELLYGRRVRGPLDLVRAQWEGVEDPEGLPILSYVLELRERLRDLTDLVHENMQSAQSQQKVWYDRAARNRTFYIGQKVLVLKPLKQNKLQASWQGPYQVVKQLCDTTYVVASCADTKIKRTFHINMMKAFNERAEAVAAICAPATGDSEYLPMLELPEISNCSGGVEDIRLGDGLGSQKREQARELLQDRQEMFSALPGYTHIAVHKVETPGQKPLRQPAYRIPGAVQEGMRAEIREMLELGVIEPSASPWASPVVLVPKRDGTTRFCVDYRRLNDCTVTDAYPMPRVDELLDKIAQGQYLTTIDLCKGYWQIPLDAEAIPKSAFITPFGLYQFLVMPFGMKNAPATFQRMIDELLDGLQDFACAYLDDIAIYSQTWEEHLRHLGIVLDRIRDANLTLKPDKCNIGMSEVQYLGHRVGCGKQRPEPAKIEAVLNWPVPRTKTQVLAFLGTAGYYRKFVPHYSDIAKPLTDLTKKTLPKQVLWSPECETAFHQLKTALTQAPILAAPDANKRFVVHTDASMFGLGAVLSQVGDDGKEHPVAYLSRKLLPREVGYAAVEKECLALVWALKKLQPYVYGRSFTVMTDHNPLIWLNRVAGENGRLLRWSLALQPYNFTIQYRPGPQNGNADGLSRQTVLEP
ncbi:uncharacterized protein LOC120928035 [Rana temporaria]|uniref:uncharacterized protein LOC120928035 n=1 Tax=Rana temporaria TaxID=8407 RepID=UPI001AAC6897|nr:uncharacterized protein LOC120928035 [Rana temporaria]